jgi:hypothetical protein
MSPGVLRTTRFAGAALLAAGALTAATASQSFAATGSVTCAYSLESVWPGGFTANLDITNTGPAINGWTTHWTFPTPTTIASTWSSRVVAETATQVTLGNAVFDATIGTAKTLRIGWVASAVTTGVPNDITVNGVPC